MNCGCAMPATGMLETYFSDKLNEFSARLEDGGEVGNRCQSHPCTYAASKLHHGQGVRHLLIPCTVRQQQSVMARNLEGADNPHCLPDLSVGTGLG